MREFLAPLRDLRICLTEEARKELESLRLGFDSFGTKLADNHSEFCFCSITTLDTVHFAIRHDALVTKI
jgi:hypothetical protein